MIQKTKKFLNAEMLYMYLTSETLDRLVMCDSAEINLFTFDQSLYEAIGSVKERKDIDYNKLVKLLEVVDVHPFSEVMKKPRKILTDDRVGEIIGGKKNE